MKQADLQKIGRLMRQKVDEATAPLLARLAELEERSMTYAGTYEAERKYTQGECVTHKGALWYCKESTDTAPGTSPAWQLTAKSAKQ